MDDRHVSRTVLRGYAQLHVPENCGGSYPMKDIQHRIHTANSSDVYGQQVLPYKKFRQKEKTMIGALVMVCTPVAGLPCAVLLPFSMASSAPEPTRSPLPRTFTASCPSPRYRLSSLTTFSKKRDFCVICGHLASTSLWSSRQVGARAGTSWARVFPPFPPASFGLKRWRVYPRLTITLSMLILK